MLLPVSRGALPFSGSKDTTEVKWVSKAARTCNLLYRQVSAEQQFASDRQAVAEDALSQRPSKEPLEQTVQVLGIHADSGGDGGWRERPGVVSADDSQCPIDMPSRRLGAHPVKCFVRSRQCGIRQQQQQMQQRNLRKQGGMATATLLVKANGFPNGENAPVEGNVKRTAEGQ
jgi:hypothetical protein